MEIEKEDFESYLKEQMEDVFAYAVLTNNGMTITKFGDNYYMKTSPDAGQEVLTVISNINKQYV
tara:strand:- start:3648 stop:3839 length:192 start_codon:yes stop_codon:yes gene_type:complete